MQKGSWIAEFGNPHNQDRDDKYDFEDSFRLRTDRTNKLIRLVKTKVHKIPDEQLDKLIQWFDDLE